MSDDGLRRLAPTGALAVGDPPVAVAAVLRAVDGARRRQPAPGSRAALLAADPDVHPADARNAAELEATRAAARRAFPRLTDEELDRALAHDHESATPTPTWPALLSLALPLGLGTLLASDGAGAALIVVLHLTWRLLTHELGPGALGVSFALALLAAIVLLTPLGVALLRLAPIARWLAALVHALAGLGVVLLAIAARGDLPMLQLLVLLLLTFGVARLLFAPAVKAWFTPDGRAARGAVPTRPYVTAVAFANLFHAVALFVVPAFHRLFKEVGINLPVATELVLTAAGFCQDSSWLTGPLFLLAPVPLLRLSPRHEHAAFLGALLLGLFVLGSTVGALFLPLLELIHAL